VVSWKNYVLGDVAGDFLYQNEVFTIDNYIAHSCLVSLPLVAECYRPILSQKPKQIAFQIILIIQLS